MSWDPKTYLSYAGERERPIAELLARVPPNIDVRSAVDLGCGTGNSTAAVKARFPDATLTGVDTSEAMLAKAKASDSTITWQLSDIATWAPDSNLDLIFSNAAFHWVPDHDALFPRLLSFLSPGGVLAFQIPRNFDALSHTLLFETASEATWAEHLAGVKPFAPMEPLEKHYDRLSPHAKTIDIWETTYAHILDGDDAVFHWVSGSALTAYLPKLPTDEMRAAFARSYKTKLQTAYPKRSDGKSVFPFKRLFVVAQT